MNFSFYELKIYTKQTQGLIGGSNFEFFSSEVFSEGLRLLTSEAATFLQPGRAKNFPKQLPLFIGP